MRPLSPVQMIGLGFFLVLLGVALPLLMVLRVIPPGFALSFVAYAASFGGLILGVIGSAMYARLKRRRDGE
jgi:membrane associated rhomboid family serine protease